MTTSSTPASAHTPAYDVATLENCEDEPIHVPGAIQPHGVLLAVDSDLVVVMASANTEVMIGRTVDEVVGSHLADVFRDPFASRVAGRVADDFPDDPMSVVVVSGGGALDGVEVDVRVHASGDRVVVELEPISEAVITSLGYRSARSAMSRLADLPTMTDLTGALATEVQHLTGFDRVMVYRFDQDWNGEVVAEVKRADLNPFFGLHYPSTDIPAQARRLYTVNAIRLIADIGYEPVPLLPMRDPGTGAPLDLSHSSLRSVSPIHVEYLSNMGVTASMSVSIVIDDELWGLVACHHYSGPHRPQPDARVAAEFVTQVASHLIAHRERADAREAAVETQTRLAAFEARLSGAEGPPLEAMVADHDFLRLVGASGAALCFDGAIVTVGATPARQVLPHVAAVTDDPDSYTSSTAYLAGLDASLAELAPVAAGVLRIGSAPDRWLMWFRPEQREVVDWGGDPTNKRLAETESPHVRLSPRKSFEKWREVTHGHSAPWMPWEIEAVDRLGRHMNSLLLLRSREQIVMAESMQRTVVLDRAPRFPGVELAARYLPASSLQLGGDWWDAFALTEHRLALVVGDVAGHGVSAASAMTQVRTALRAYLFEGHDPADCLARLDRLMDELLGVGIATAMVAVLDRRTHEVEIAAAGHPPPVVSRADGATSLVDLHVRPLLGVSADRGSVTRLHLDPGDRLVLYTDGLVERRGWDLDTGMARLLRAAEAAAGVDLDTWTDRLVATLGEGADDDTTVLALELQ